MISGFLRIVLSGRCRLGWKTLTIVGHKTDKKYHMETEFYLPPDEAQRFKNEYITIVTILN